MKSSTNTGAKLVQLKSHQSNSNLYEVVYNLKKYHDELYLPEAYIVLRDKKGLLAHIQQKAIPVTLGAFNLELDSVKERLFKIIAELQEEQIVSKFHTGRKKPPALKAMLENKVLSKNIQNYIHRRLNLFLQAIVNHQLPLSWNAERRVLVKDFLIDTEAPKLEPHLFFKKTKNGVLYQLKLKKNDHNWSLLDKDIVAITNQPKGWIFADYKLYQLKNVNGFLIKPFRKKQEITIPSSSVNAYFRNFIMKIVNKVEIEAEGFEVVQYNEIEKCVIEPIQDIFKNSWALAVQMHYKGADFGWNENRDKKTSLEINTDEIRIIQVLRDEKAEAIFIDKLKTFPFKIPKDRQQFELSEDTDNPYALLEWISRERTALEKVGFQISSPLIGDKKLELKSATIDVKIETEADWFDIKGNIQVGDFSFPFMKLAKYIRDNNRFYPLPNGTFFLIPTEWMARYQGLAEFGKKSGEHLKITKSQYTLLEEIGLNTEIKQEEDFPKYTASPLLHAKLRPYQHVGIQWLSNLYHQELGACLADDMGLGKTLQTIAILLYAKEQKAKKLEQKKNESPLVTGQQLGLFAPASDIRFLQPLQALIVMPSSLLFNWEKEITKFAPSLSIYQHYGAKRHKDPRIISRFDTILTTYQTALRDIETLQKLGLEYIILDESQQIKNRNSKIFKALNKLGATHKISLSGTPIENSLSDLWSQMQFINEGLLGNYSFFKKTFVTPIEKEQDEDKTQQLRQLVGPYLLRRTKGEVAKDLPSLTTQVFYSEMTSEQRKIYEKEKSAARNYLLDNFEAKSAQYRILVLQTLTKLRQLANHPVLTDPDYQKGSGKFHDILEQWQIIQQSGHKVLLFSSFVKYLELFKTAFEEKKMPYSWLSGSTPNKKRVQEIEKFQNDPTIQSFLISIKSGGTGLNLTAADYVFILDPWWNPTTEQQAIARAHRIGQKNNVIALKFITKDSIEEKILTLQSKKLKLAEDIIGKGSTLSFERHDIAFLLD